MLRGRHTKQFVRAYLDISPVESCRFASQQLCYQQALTAVIATTTTSFALPCRGIKRRKKWTRNKGGNEDNKTVLQEGFFLEQNGVAPFLAKTCVNHIVQLKTLVPSGHNGCMADQGGLHHPFRTDGLPALWLPPWLQICWWPSILVQWLNSCCD